MYCHFPVTIIICNIIQTIISFSSDSSPEIHTASKSSFYNISYNVIIDNENADHLKYQGEALVPVLVKAIQEQQAIIESLKARLDAANL